MHSAKTLMSVMTVISVQFFKEKQQGNAVSE